MPRRSLAQLAALNVDDFLRQPGIDERPYLEHFGDRVEPKSYAGIRHSIITKRLVASLDGFAKAGSFGEALPKLRCSFAGRSIIPDVVFVLRENLPWDDKGQLANEFRRSPDIAVEIMARVRSLLKTREKISHATNHGCPLGWLIHSERKWVEVYRAGQEPERLADDGELVGEPVLPGFRLPVAEVFGWLNTRDDEAIA